MLLVLGCAQHKAYRGTTGISDAESGWPGCLPANFVRLSSKIWITTEILDVVGGASSPGMVTISYGDGKGAHIRSADPSRPW